MTWFLYSISAALFFTGMVLCVRKLTNFGFSSKQVLFFLSGFVFVGFAILNLFLLGDIWYSEKLSFFLLVIFIAGIFAAIGNWAAFEGIKRAPNPGYSTAIKSTVALPLTLLSVPLFNSDFSLLKLLGVMSVITGIFLLVIGRERQCKVKTKDHWYLFPLLAVLAFTVSLLAVKQATLIPDVYPREIILLVFGINFFFFFFLCRKELNSYFADKLRLRAFLPFAISAAAFSFFGNYFGITALSIAPNPGYYEMIRHIDILFITLISVKLFSIRLDRIKFLGITLIFIGLFIFVI